MIHECIDHINVKIVHECRLYSIQWCKDRGPSMIYASSDRLDDSRHMCFVLQHHIVQVVKSLRAHECLQFRPSLFQQGLNCRLHPQLIVNHEAKKTEDIALSKTRMQNDKSLFVAIELHPVMQSPLVGFF